jgi:glutaredoxin
MSNYRVEIFYAEVCGLCHKAMDAFRDRGLNFDAIEVGYDPQADDWIPSPQVDEMKRRAGEVDFVPQIFVNGHHIAGWKQLEPMLHSGEFDRLLQPED